MIAELLEGKNLRPDRNHLAEDLHFLGSALNGESARARRLKSDKEHQVSWVRQTQKQVVEDAATGDHSARRDDDAGILDLVDLLGILRSTGKGKAVPLQRRTIFLDEPLGVIVELIGVLQKD